MVTKIDSSCIPSSFSKIAITFYMLLRASILRMNQIEASYSLFLKQRVTTIETVWSEVFPPFHARLEWKRGKTIKDYYCFLPVDSSRLVRLQRICTKAIAGNGLILHITWARLSTYVKSCFHDLSRLAFWMCKSFHNSFPSRPREREVLRANKLFNMCRRNRLHATARHGIMIEWLVRGSIHQVWGEPAPLGSTNLHLHKLPTLKFMNFVNNLLSASHLRSHKFEWKRQSFSFTSRDNISHN